MVTTSIIQLLLKNLHKNCQCSLNKLSKENEPRHLAGDFNMNLLQFETKPEIENYFDVMTNQNFTPLITYPTRITSKSKTLIDNIFFNEFSSDIVSGNLTVGLSDHIPQFALIPNKTLKSSTNNKTPQYRSIRRYKKIDLGKFNEDLDKINWDTNELNVHQYGNNLLNVFDQVLDVHAPLTKVKDSKNHEKQKAKPWITKNILKLTKNKDKIYKRYIKEQNISIKDQLLSKYEQQKMK